MGVFGNAFGGALGSRGNLLLQEDTGGPYENFLKRSDLPHVYYSSLNTAMNAVKADYPNGLTQDVEILCIKNVTEVRNPTDPTKTQNLRLWTVTLSEWNKDTIYSLIINGAHKYTLSAYSLGGIHIDGCDNIVFKNMKFADYSNFIKSSSPEEMSALYSTGSLGSKNKNIAVLNCEFNGVYTDSNLKDYYADYAFDTKLTSNILIQNCVFTQAAAVPIKCSDVDVISIKSCKIAGQIKRNTIPHETLCNISGATLVEVSDTVFDGNSLMEYGISFTDVSEYRFNRNTFHNFAATVLLINGTDFSKISMESCLFYNCLHTYVLNYLKFLMRVEAPLRKLSLVNNTVYMDGNGVLYQEAFSVNANIDELINYNNIFINKNNKVNAFISSTGLITAYSSSNNIYKALFYSSGTRFNDTRILSCDSFNSSIGATESRMISQYQTAGYESNSIVLSSTANLLNIETAPDGDYKLRSQYSAQYISNNSPALFDIEYKKIDSQTVPTVGAYNLNGIFWDETTDTDETYNGINIVDNTTFSNSAQYVVPADDTIMLSSNTLDRSKLITFIIESSLYNIMRYGNNTVLTLKCDTDSNQMYLGNTMYSVTLKKENIL